MKNEAEVLEQLRAAESMIGTPTTEMFMDHFPEHRLRWLSEVRALLKANGIEPENLDGHWHTNGRVREHGPTNPS